MPKWSPTPFPRGRALPAFRRQMVELVLTGRTPEKPGPWARIRRPPQPGRAGCHDDGRIGGGLSSAEREEMRRLRREHCRLCEERAIVATGAAWSVRDVRSVRSPGSSERIRTISGLPRGTGMRGVNEGVRHESTAKASGSTPRALHDHHQMRRAIPDGLREELPGSCTEPRTLDRPPSRGKSGSHDAGTCRRGRRRKRVSWANGCNRW